MHHLCRRQVQQKSSFWWILLVGIAASAILLASLPLGSPAAAEPFRGDNATASPSATTATTTPAVTNTATSTLTATATLTSSPTTSPTYTPTAETTDTPTPSPTPTSVNTSTPTQTHTPPTTAAKGLPPSSSPPQSPAPYLVVGIAILLLGVGGTAFLVWRTRQPPTKPAPVPPAPPPKSLKSEKPEVTLPPTSLATTVRPAPGTPYLESLGRPAGVVYCSLTQPLITIGRGTDNDMLIDEHFVGWSTVSRQHATVEHDGEHFVVVDLKSRNGTYVNDQRTGENMLYDGYVVSFGQVGFVFRMNLEGSPV